MNMSPKLQVFGVVGMVLALGVGPVMAGDVTINGSNLTADAGTQTTLGAGGKIIFASNHDLIMTGVSLTNVTGIQVNNGVTADISFGATTNTITFLSTGASIDIQGTGTLTIAGTDAGAGFTFGAATGQTLTVNKSIAGAVNANKFIIGNNTLQVTAATTFAGTVSIGGASAVLDIDAATTITTPVMTGSLNITPADTMVLTLSSALAVGANTLTCTGSGAGGAEAINGTINLNNASSQLVTAGVDADDILGDVTVTVNADGAILDVNANTSPVAVNMTTQSGDLTLKVNTGKTLTTSIDVNENTLTLSEAGAVTTITMDTANGVLDVDEDVTVTTITNSAAFTIDVAANKTLTNTVNIATRTLTLTGTGTISRVDATTGTITDNGGSTISDLRVTAGAGTFTINGTGDLTVTTLNNSTFANGNIFAKAGAGALTIASGLTTPFAGAVTQLVNVNAGTLVVGSAGTNDDITFAHAGDKITVANGATLTTYGSFTSSNAGTHINALAGSTVNLSSTSGAETFTAAGNGDFKLLGTVNINGSNGDYSMAGAFEHQFGDVNINATGSLINIIPSSTMKFVPSSTITLTGDATLTISGQAADTRVTLNTTNGTGQFTLNRGSSANATIHNTSVANSLYTSTTSYTAQCDLGCVSMDYGINLSNWVGDCPAETTAPSGTDTTTDTTTDETADETTDDTAEDTSDDTTDNTSDTTEDETTDDTADDDTAADTGTDSVIVGDNGTAEISNDAVMTTIEGLEEGTTVALETDENGDSTLTLTDSEDNDVFSLAVEGAGEGVEIAVVVNEDGDQAVVMTAADGSAVRLNMFSLPEGSNVTVQTNEDGDVTVAVTDESGEVVDVTIEATGAGDDVTFNVTYNIVDVDAAGRVIPGFPGFENEETLGGSITITATGLPEDSVVTVALTYDDADLTGIDEADLRVQKLNKDTGLYEPAGNNDVGVGEPTGVLSDYGVDTDTNSAWAGVSTLGTFAVGVPDNSAYQEVVPDGTGTAANQACGAGAAPCGTTGMVTWFMMVSGLVAMRRRYRHI